MPSVGEIERLSASGWLAPRAGDLLDLGEPLPPAPSAPLPSEALAEARADER